MRILLLSFFILLSGIGNAQVNLQTGSATFSLPMFNWQDNKSRLTSVVELSYNSGNGLKVDDVASNEGQGWNLLAGGVISRMPVDLPDDQIRYDVPNDQLGRFPGGILYPALFPQNTANIPSNLWGSPITPSYGCPHALNNYPIYTDMNQLYRAQNDVNEDRQLDYFSFQFNGKAGMFVLDPNNIGTCQPLGDTKMIITFQTDNNMHAPDGTAIRTSITSFTVKDVDGLIYKFTYHGLSKTLKTHYCDNTFTQILNQPSFSPGQVFYQTGFDNQPEIVNPWQIGSWYLSEVDDPLTGRQIILTYNNINSDACAGSDVTYTRSDNGQGTGDYTIISRKRSITITPEISTITYPDNHVVSFTYQNTTRFDFNGEHALSAVDITYQQRPVSEYQLNTSYFISNRYGTPVSAYDKSISRLCLRSIKKIGVDLKEDTPPYVFDYYLGSGNDDIVPPPFFYAKDIWGFYNGNASVAYDGSAIPLNGRVSDLNNNQLKGLCFLNGGMDGGGVVGSGGLYLNPKSGYAKNGLLKQITYPTGGSISYQYSQNQGTLPSSSGDVMVGGVSVSQTSTSDEGFAINCNNPPITTNYNYVTNGVGSPSSMWGLENPANSLSNSSSYRADDKVWHYSLRHWSLFGTCYWKYLYPGILSTDQSISLDDFANFMDAIAPVLSVISIVCTVLDVINVCLDATPMVWVAIIIDIVGGIVSVVISCIDGSHPKFVQSTVFYNEDLNGVSPLPSQYKRVEVVESPGNAGKTVQTFTSSDQYPVWFDAGMNPYFSAKQRFAPWAYGLPLVSSTYDANGNLLKETDNFYDYSNAKRQVSSASCKCQVLQNYSQPNTDWQTPSNYDDLSTFTTTSNADVDVDIYNMYSGRTQLSSTIEKTFEPNNSSQYVQTETVYNYSPKNYCVDNIITFLSNGDKVTKIISYDDDYPAATAGILNTLVANNILSVPVENFTYILKNINGTLQEQPSILNEEVTEFTRVATGDIQPSRKLEQRFTSPQLAYTVYQGPAATNNPTDYKQTETFTYDFSNGDLIGVKDEGNRSVRNIYDYDDKYVTATVINSDPSDTTGSFAAYTSFETSSFGGWLLTGSPGNFAGTANYVNTNSVTGSRAFVLSSANNSLSFDNFILPSTKNYILSFWATKTVNITAVGAQITLVKAAPIYNGFTYYEYVIAKGATNSIILTGNANIDELRIYPQDARMRTTTYDPLIGKTSECDENNRITYYLYDDLGRLQFVQDEHHNVIKMYEYNNNSGSHAACPVTYTNTSVSETYTKSNCPAGYIGGQVVYTVPANKYTSTISQDDVNVQVENDLLANGQAYADANGTCLQVYYNAAQSATDTAQGCAVGSFGNAVTYTVPTGTYSSTISQADADQKAINDVNANAVMYANANGVCTPTTDAVWEAEDSTAQTQCEAVAGGDIDEFMLMTDVNPNSPTFNQTQYIDVGPQDACNGYVPPVYVKLVYFVNISEPVGQQDQASIYFFSDAACTIPLSYAQAVSQAGGASQVLILNYQADDVCPDGTITTDVYQGIIQITTTTPLVTFGQQNDSYGCTYVPRLIAGTGYIVVN
jgi:hypothetical protein